MQTPDQSPEELEEARQVEQQPFYEFPPSGPLPALPVEEAGKADSEVGASPQVSTTESGQIAASQAHEDLIRQGLV